MDQERLREFLQRLKIEAIKKALVCSDPDLIKSRSNRKVTKILDENNIEYEIFSEIKPNPTIENVQSGVKKFKIQVRI